MGANDQQFLSQNNYAASHPVAINLARTMAMQAHRRPRTPASWFIRRLRTRRR